jgi:hypothetical protein
MREFVDKKCKPEDFRCYEVRIGHDKARVFTSSDLRAERIFTQGMGIRNTQHEVVVTESSGTPAESATLVPLEEIVTHDGTGYRTDPILGTKTQGGRKILTDAEKMAAARSEG